jgi:molybdopterin molybdotransferase
MMLSLDEARAAIAQTLTPLAAVRAPLAEARGRVLREDVAAGEDMPAFDRAAMDGYAIVRGDAAERFRVVAVIQPGATSSVTLRPGECARIFTGAAIPAGASQVLMQEDTRSEGEFMVPMRRPAAAHIRVRGEDARAGTVLLRSGVRLGPAELALLAQLGATEPLVSAAMRVLHCTTGNELVDPALTPAAGQLRDSNSTLVAALLAERGARLIAQRRCGDSLEALVGAIKAAGQGTWDVALISGGASVGDYDFGARALERLGFQMHFRQINLRPGKPLIFATRERQAAFVVPGNPVSHFVTFHVAIARAFEALEGGPPAWTLAAATLAAPIDEPPNPRETWWPARVSFAGGRLCAQPLAWQSSGDLCGLAGVNALLRLPPGAGTAPAGGAIETLRLAL